ncbi:MAG: glycosyltransferase family 39 protein [Luteimonas sp.]|nr:glycosyltransferase family 39 protein [Luteimonas sp.]
MVVLGLVLALGFLGTRGIWDPDEGRYTNVALTMLDSGNWLDPMRNGDTGHWTKPPMTYWLVAASVATFGQTPWAARLPTALSYLACMALAWLCARRLAKGSEHLAALAYATMLLPFGAGQLVTTDFLLAAFQTLAVYGFIAYRFGDSCRPQCALLLMWAAFALAFMTKGPPALVPLLAIVVLRFLRPGSSRCGWPWHMGGIALFLALAMPWYVAVSLRHDGLLSHFVGAEVVDRVASDRFQRNGEWYGWLKVYLPTLLIGSLPWTATLLRWARGLPAGLRAWRSGEGAANVAGLFVALWVLLPLAVFCIARSRLPLYVLPLFVPLAIAIAMTWRARGTCMPKRRWLALWVVLLLGLRLAGAHFPSQQDASGWARAIAERAPGAVNEVIFVEDMARYGLRLHLDAEIEKVSSARQPSPQPRFNPTYDETLWDEIRETGLEDGLIYVTKQATWPDVERIVSGHGYRARPLGSPHEGRIIFEVLVEDEDADGAAVQAGSGGD